MTHASLTKKDRQFVSFQQNPIDCTDAGNRRFQATATQFLQKYGECAVLRPENNQFNRLLDGKHHYLDWKQWNIL